MSAKLDLNAVQLDILCDAIDYAIDGAKQNIELIADDPDQKDKTEFWELRKYALIQLGNYVDSRRTS